MFKKTILFIAIFSLVFLSACGVKKEKQLTLEEAKVVAEKFINDNFMDPLYPIEISSIEDDSQTGLYKFSIDFGNGELIDSYISKDGQVLFPQAYDMSELEKTLNNDNNFHEASLEEDIMMFDEDVVENDLEVIPSEKINLNTDQGSGEKVVVYFFWGEGCPHCTTQKTAMQQWAQKYPEVEIKSYETWNDQSNQVVLENLAGAYGTSVRGVPMTFIGDKYWTGYAASSGTEMETKIEECLKVACENPGDRIN